MYRSTQKKGAISLKRLYAAIAFLLIILATSAFTIFQCRQFHNQAIPQVEQIIEYAETGHLEQAAGLSGQFFDSWSKTRDSMVWYIRHEPLEKITGIASRAGIARPSQRPLPADCAGQRADCPHRRTVSQRTSADTKPHLTQTYFSNSSRSFSSKIALSSSIKELIS